MRYTASMRRASSSSKTSWLMTLVRFNH